MAKDMQFDPKDFISPPYQVCPKCGHKTFGVLSIDGESYTRRCRDCWHMQRGFPLPPIRKRIIYLDQYVVSNLMKLDNPALQRNDTLKSNPFWTELRDLLNELKRLQLIVCPDSASHVSESRISPFNAELKKMYEHLSSGITFKSFDSIAADQIGDLGLAWAESREPVFRFNPSSALTEDPNRWSDRFYITMGDNPFLVPDEVKTFRAAMHQEIARLFRDVWAVERRTFQYWYDLERHGYQGHLSKAVMKSRRDRWEATLAYRPGVEPSLENLGRMLLSPAEVLVESLSHIMRFPRKGGERTPEDVDALERSFGDANRIAEAPFVKLQSLLFASIAMRAQAGQKEPPNEGMMTDIETVAHLLPYCDGMLMDNDCRALLLNIPQALRPAEAARVFSLNNREAFLAYLRQIREEASQTQLDAVRELYGDS